MLRMIRLVRGIFPVTFLILTLMMQIAQTSEYEGAIVSTIEPNNTYSSPILMGKRAMFFGQNRSWVFYVDGGSWLIWSSSIDAETWETPYVIGQHSQYAVAYDESKGYVHLAYAGLFGDLYYRRGTLNGTLGLISWNSTAVVDGAVSACASLSIDYDSSGYCYLSYSNGSSATQPYFDKNSDNTTGAWVGDAGFPLALNSTGNWYAGTQLNVLENDNVIVVYRAVSVPPSPKAFSRLYCANNGTLNAQTPATKWTIRSGFSMVSVGNDTYLLYDAYEAGEGGGDLANRVAIHNYTTLSWALEEEMIVWAILAGDICHDWINERVYAFSFGLLDDSMLNITYYDLNTQTWVAQEVIEEFITLNNVMLSGTATIDQYGRMGFAWCQTLYPPYVLRFAWVSPDLSPPEEEEEEEEDEPLPDFLSMYIHLGLMIFGLLMMFFAVIWLAWGIKKKGVNEVTIERGGYSMLLFFVGFALLMGQLYSGAG